MKELRDARTQLRESLAKAIKGTAATERIDELIDRHQSAVKGAAADRLIDLSRRLSEARALHTYWQGDCRECGREHPCPTVRAIDNAG